MVRNVIVCLGVAGAGVASAAPKAGVPAAPRVSADAQYKLASTQYSNGNYQQALELIEQGLAVAPKDLKLLGLKGTLLLQLRDYPKALATYQAYLKAGVTGANQREAQKIVDKLLAVESTFLDITVANGPAEVYLDSKTLGLFCHAAPSCHEPVLPLDYKVIAERPGFERWTSDLRVEKGQTTKLTVTLVDKPSPLTVRAAPEGATVTVDDAAYDPSKPLPAGAHRVAVSLAGHKDEQRQVEAREGKPIELEVVLSAIVPVAVEPPTAQLLLGGEPIALTAGGIPVPPGAHKLVVRAPGHQEREIAIPAERGGDYKVEVKLAPIVLARPAVVAPPPSRPIVFTPRRKLALAAAGAGAVAFGVGVGLGLRSGQLDDDAYALCPSPETPCVDARKANELNERARSRALQANIAYGIAGGAAVAAAVLWLTGAPESRVAVTPQLGAVAGLDVAVRF